MKRRKRFRTAIYDALWEQYKHKCWRCGLSLESPLVPGKDWHWGHLVALGCGGEDKPENLAPECCGCNAEDARTHATPMAAKNARIRRTRFGVKKPSRFPSGDGKYKFNWHRGRYEKVDLT